MTPRAWALFAGVSILWGFPYLCTKVAVDDGVPFGFVAWVRVALAAVALLALAGRAGTLAPLRGHGGWLTFNAFAQVAIPIPLIAAGQKHVSSSLAAILISSAPLFTALLALRMDHEERPTVARTVGLLLGLGGVVALVGLDVAGSASELLGALLVLVAAFGYAIGPMYYKRHLLALDASAAMGASLAIATIVMLPLVALDPPDAVPSVGACAALVALGLPGTAAAFACFGVLIAWIGASRAIVVTYIAPVVALILGVALASEAVGVGTFVGLVLILGGSWLSTAGRLPRRRRTRTVADADVL